MQKSHSFRKTLLSASVASVLGFSTSGPVGATTYTFEISGAFTMLNASGKAVANAPSPYQSEYYWAGKRTPVVGSMTYDDVTGLGTLTFNGFYFFGSAAQHLALAHDVSIVNIGNGTCTNDDPAQGCGAGKLLLGNMLFRWNTTDDNDLAKQYPVSNVWDATGLLDALPTTFIGEVIENVGASPATDNLNFGSSTTPAFLPLGDAPLAVTTWNTTINGDPSLPRTDTNCGTWTIPGSNPPAQEFTCANVNPSGILPLLPSTIGASPIIGTSFGGFYPNFDLLKITVTCIDADCIDTPPEVASRLPGAGATGIGLNTNIIVNFTKQMKADTVAAAFSMAGPGGPISGVLDPSIGDATQFTFNPDLPLEYLTTYSVTITGAAEDTAGNQPLLNAPVEWSFTTQEPSKDCTVEPQVPVGSNFTMINPLPEGKTFPEGTNDIVYSFEINGTPIDIDDLDNRNTAVSGAGVSTKFNMTLATARPQGFFGYTWIAHHVRVFDEGTYVFNTECSVAQIEGGTCTPNATPSKNLTMTVGAGQIGAHMLFDWGQTRPESPCGKANCNIDVVNVWDRGAMWNRNPNNLDPEPDTNVNDVFTGETWAGPDGLTVNPKTIWDFVSTDPDGDGVNGVPMVDGAFIGYSANFNLGPADSCIPGEKTVIEVGESSSFPGGGCSISRNPAASSVLGRSEWLLIGGFIAWLGALRSRFRRTIKG